MKDEPRELLVQAGAIDGRDPVQIARARAREVRVARITLALRSDGAVFERIVAISDAPSCVRGVLEEGSFATEWRSIDALPGPLLEAAEHALEAQRACGYDSVEVKRIALAEERVVEVRYRPRDGPKRTVWLGTAPPRVLAAETHRARVVLPTVSLPPRDELAAISAVIAWFVWMGWLVLGP